MGRASCPVRAGIAVYVWRYSGSGCLRTAGIVCSRCFIFISPQQIASPPTTPAMADDMQDDESTSRPQQQQRPQITLNKNKQIRTKGRGFQGNWGDEAQDRYAGKAGEFESLNEEGSGEAQKCQSPRTHVLAESICHPIVVALDIAAF
jgi:hypothetical protein